MTSESKSSAAPPRRSPWPVWRLPDVWTLWTETWLWSLAIHLTAGIVAALAIHNAIPVGRAIPQRTVTITASFGAAPATQRFSLSLPPAESEEQPLAVAATSSAPVPQAVLPEAATAGGGEPRDRDSREMAEAMALVVGLKRRSDGPPAGGTGLVPGRPIGAGRGGIGIGPGLDVAAVLAADAKIPRPRVPTGPVAPLSLFGIDTEGRSFVFLIDRSASMGAGGLGVMQIAAKELTAHLDTLSPAQTFQVVAYNQSVAYVYGRDLLPASEENRHKLVRFVSDLAAFGQTDHTRGLLAALKLNPEVIFLFTDGGDPQPDNGQIRVVREAASGKTSIHCLHFGRGRAGEPARFLQRLAADNRGRYVYIDVNGR
jgi:von Willebrand factor type A domain-containing protein